MKIQFWSVEKQTAITEVISDDLAKLLQSAGPFINITFIKSIDDYFTDGLSIGDATYKSLYESLNNIKYLVDDNRKIDAIKLTRLMTRWGLKECKDFVEAL